MIRIRSIYVFLLLLTLCLQINISFSQTDTYSTPGAYSWTCPNGVNSVTVECWGAGGGGGIVNGSGGGGGGGGAYARTNSYTVTPGTSYAVVVGAGGAADIAAGGGTRTSFGGTIVVADYGLGTTNETGAAGGTVANSTGTIRYVGGTGGTGLTAGDCGGGGGGCAGTSGAGINGFNATATVGGAGGTGNNGLGGAGGAGGNGGIGGAGTSNALGGGGGGGGDNGFRGGVGGSPGAGGGGGENSVGGSGTGAPGCVILTYTCPAPLTVNAGTDQVLSSCATSTTLAGNSVPAGASGIWTVISGTATITTPSSPTSTVTGIALGTTVTLGWTITNGSCGSVYDEMNITTSFGTSCFCTPDFPSGVYSITRVQFGSIDNSSASVSGGTTPDWEDYTAFSTSVTPGTTYPITITATGLGTTNVFYVSAYFDWNNDGDFYDSGEQSNLGTFASNSAVVSGNIYVPDFANTGTIRMRVISKFGTYSNPCNTAGNGQSEDYSVSVSSMPDCSGAPTSGSVTPALSNITTQNSLSLYWSELPQNGFTYQWQNLDGFGIWNNISGATASFYNLTGLSEGTFFYRLIVTCTNSGLSVTSAQAQVNITIGYCTTDMLDCTANDKITRVQINTLDNSNATCNSPSGYSDYTGLAPTSLTIGSSYNLSITVGNGSGSHSAGVWFDFNRNGSFSDAGEFFSIAQGTIIPSSTTTVSIAIPTTATTGNTRMRIQYGWGPTLLSSWVCFSNLTYGEWEDYTVNLICVATPNDVTGRSPANTLALPCGSAAALSWNPHTCATGFKVYLDTSNPPTTLVSTTTGTSYYTGNLSDGTVYYWKIVPYNGGVDGTGSVWSFTTIAAINVVSSTDEEGCADGGLCLDVSGGTFPDYYWYDVPVGGAPVATGTQYCPAGLTDTTTFYVSNVYQGTPTSINAAASSSVVCVAGSRGYGNMFNVRAKAATIEITGLSVRFRDLGTAGSAYRPVKIYYRTNSFIGNAVSSSGWILLYSTAVNVPNTTTVPTNFSIPSLFVPAGTTYGIYIVFDNQYLSGAGVYANSDLELITGSSICGGEFSSEVTDRTFQGTVYYTISCSSPTSSVVATPYVSNNFVSLVGSSVTGLVEQCTEYGWTYYSQAATPSNWLFAIKKNGNTFTATVDITKGAGVYQSVNVAGQHGSFLMGRYWNATLTSGSINPALPVSVRFFFDPNEITNAVNARNTVQASYPGTFATPWRWFKSVGVAFNPGVNIDGSAFLFTNATLTTTGALTISGAPYSGTVNGVSYVDLDGITSFSGGTGGIGFNPWNTPLPVHLLNFTATHPDDYTLLNWITLSETNNDYFDVERSEDLNFWKKIGLVYGAVNSSSLINYSFTDEEPLINITYYRLKQVDFDGNFSHSNIVSVNPNTKAIYDLSSFYTNTTDNIHVTISSNPGQKYSLKITDLTGSSVFSYSGLTEFSSTDINIAASSWKEGVYIIYIIFENTTLTNKLIIVR